MYIQKDKSFQDYNRKEQHKRQRHTIFKRVSKRMNVQQVHLICKKFSKPLMRAKYYQGYNIDIHCLHIYIHLDDCQTIRVLNTFHLNCQKISKSQMQFNCHSVIQVFGSTLCQTTVFDDNIATKSSSVVQCGMKVKCTFYKTNNQISLYMSEL